MKTGWQWVIGMVFTALALVASAETTPAVWKEREFKFAYHGFTTSYSCEGLKYKVRLILAELGARSNPEIRTSGCEPGGGVAVFPSLHIRAAFPDALPAGNDDAQSFAAQADVVTLGPGHPRGLEMGDCELVEQLRHDVIAEIGSRMLTDRTGCVPHQANLGRPYLQFETLRPAAGKIMSTAR